MFEFKILYSPFFNFLIFRLTFAFPPSNFLGIFIRVVSFRSFTLFVYARFLRQSLIVVVRALLLLLLLIHYFITVVLNYRRTLFKRSSRIISDIVLFSRKFPRF